MKLKPKFLRCFLLNATNLVVVKAGGPGAGRLSLASQQSLGSLSPGGRKKSRRKSSIDMSMSLQHTMSLGAGAEPLFEEDEFISGIRQVEASAKWDRNKVLRWSRSLLVGFPATNMDS